MKYLLILFLLLFISCKTIEKNPSFLVIKYKRFNQIKFDWYSRIEISGNYCIYYKNTILGTKTNYIHGDFELTTYKEYIRSTK